MKDKKVPFIDLKKTGILYYFQILKNILEQENSNQKPKNKTCINSTSH